MSDTPRTDAASWREHQQSVVDADFARQLERDLVAAKAELAQRTAEVAKATAQRDEARRDACFARCNPWIPEHHLTVAIERGWDCFKEVKP
jgi:hypothetical protein